MQPTIQFSVMDLAFVNVMMGVKASTRDACDNDKQLISERRRMSNMSQVF